jgi:sigma-B regulation protein RsbU (phosphoserine phosphatase)
VTSLQTAPATAPATVPAPAHGEQGDRILLVDDTPTNLHVLYQTLDGQGYELLVAQNGEEAMALALDARPALVLLDIMMPGIDGLETCRRLKADPRTRDSAVIFMSALDDTRDKVRGLEAGAVDYITKPFQAAEVIARVRTHLELRRLHRELAEANKTLAAANRKMKQDLAAAAMVQRALLPSRAPGLAGYELRWRYRPCDELAGDLLNVFPLRDGHIGAYVLDVSGHGVAASLLAVSVTQSIVPRDGGPSVVTDPTTGGIGPPALVAARLNERYPMSAQANRYFTLAYGVLDPATGTFRHVCAGHPAPVLVRGSGAVESLDQPNFAIGMVPGADYAESVIELRPGDRLYLHSDGLIEERNPESEQFGRHRLQAQLRAARDVPLQESVDALIEAVVTWRGQDELSDDVTVLAIERGDSRNGSRILPA